MTDLEQLRRRANEILSRWRGEALTASTAASQARGFTAAAMLASIGTYLLLWDVPLWAKMIAILGAAAAVRGRSRGAVLLVLVWLLTGGLMLDVLLAGRQVFAQDWLRFEDWLATTALLAFAMFAFRVVELPRAGESGAAPGLGSSPSRTASRRSPQMSLLPFSGAALRLAAAPGVALALLWLAPRERFYGNELKLSAAFYRALVFLWTIGLLSSISATGFSILGWRRLSQQQGSIYARWVILDESRREQAAVERARVRRLRRRAAGEQ
jgi:hypothetical protein